MVDRLAVRSYTVKALGCQEKVVLAHEVSRRPDSVIDSRSRMPLEWPPIASFSGGRATWTMSSSGAAVEDIASMMSRVVPESAAHSRAARKCFYGIEPVTGRRWDGPLAGFGERA